ncbi:sugar-binding transcriptional regulator [Arenivirga flava]|uniref:Transcriptional regulator n=1 Tax=Arenivirga flava TaxID=1930060 RepID=A0AA37UHP0_9MICO|nr:transcriptional regulator [Arenivirga flava]
MTPDTDLDERTRTALRAAHLYYVQELTMEAIARELRSSRSSVSRLLAYARETGLVQIQIHSPHEGRERVEREIQRRYHVHPHVIPVPDATSDVDRLDRVALAAGRLLGRYVDSNMRIGIGWGSTMSALSRHLVPKSMHATAIVQLNGAANNLTSGIDYTSEILRRFGAAFGAQVHQFPVPAFFDDPSTRDAMWRERSVGRMLEMQASLDLVLFSVGSPTAEVPSHVYLGGYLDAADYASLAEDGVAGDVATVFYRADGSSAGIRLNERASGPNVATLRRAPRRLCVVAGVSKIPALRGALAAGLVTDLVIDETAARRLIEA